MKIAFKFENGTSQLILTPTDARDKTYLDLCLDGKNDIRLKATSSESVILEFKAVEPAATRFVNLPTSPAADTLAHPKGCGCIECMPEAYDNNGILKGRS